MSSCAWGPRYAVLLAGAGWKSKVLPTSTLTAVAAGLAEQGLTVVIAWGPGEREVATGLAHTTGGRAIVAPPTDLLQLTGLLGQSALVIGSDTGPLHIAASLGVPTVGVFLTTSPLRNGPLGPRAAIVTSVIYFAHRSGSARARPAREVDPAEILSTALQVLDSG